MKKRGRLIRLAVAGVVALVLAAAAVGLVAVRQSRESRSLKARADAIGSKKGDADRIKPGRNAETVIGANEYRAADSSPDVEAYLKRAYPADEVPWEATIAAQNGWAALKASKHSAGSWQLIGPSQATYPEVLNVLGDGAKYIAAGRVTAMALAPNCEEGHCRLYVAAAGGGIWRTDKALHTNPSQKWEFVSDSFATNAIGSLIIDPNDPTGNTLYAGTGEPNVSVDSEAGMGIYKSTDGGDSWTHLASMVTALTTPGNGTYTGDAFAARAISAIAVDPTNANVIYVASARGVRGVSSTDGGPTSNPPTPRPPFGLFKSTDGGATFTFVWNGNGTNRGVIHLALDPSNTNIVYASALNQGTWRSMNGGTTFSLIKARLSANDPDRPEFAVTTLPNGKTRMYLGEGVAGTPPARFFRTDDAAGAAVFTDMTTAQNINYCEGQCWYDNVVYSPAGYPDVVYLLGSFDYGQIHGKSNGRGVLLSTDGGATWSDLTQDGDPNHAEFTHPDQHAIVTLPSNPFLYWEGSDGGIVSSDGNFADVSYKCDQRGLNAAATAYCKSLLSRVPHQLANNINSGFSTLQFQSLSVSAKHPKNNAQGGTQDNGTFQYDGSAVVWNQEMYGDGGQSGFNAADDSLRFNTFTGQANDVNFRKGDPTKWCVATGVILSSPEGSYFYPPVIADPNPSKGGTIFQGSFSIWRTQDWGGDRDYLEANCPEFTTSAANTACGDFVQIGPTGATDLTGATYSVPAPARIGGAVAVIKRRAADTGTLWAATGAGRVFISTNANDPASSVTFTRIDNQSGLTSPARFPTGIYIDPTNANHGWISYSGYNFNTVQSGHVFEVTWNGATATWADRSYNLPDLPITDLVRDDVTGDLYAASDFGVMRLANASTTWTVAGTGLPQVEVPGLTIVPSARLLYAATHGRSAWVLQLP
jgi:hypothetical protein